MRTPWGLLRAARRLGGRVVAIDERTDRVRHDLDRAREQISRLEGEVTDLRRDAVRAANLATRAAGLRRPRLRIVLLVHNSSAWDSLHSVWEAMAGHPDVEPVVASIPRHFGGHGPLAHEDEVHRDLEARGVPHLRCEVGEGPLVLLQTLAPDIVFRQSQWDEDVDPRLSTDHLTFTRTCLVPYEMLNPIRNLPQEGTRDSAVDRAFHHEAWLVLGIASTVAAATAVGRRQGAQFRDVGHPKVDALTVAEPRWPLPGALPRFVLSTHHSLAQEWTRFGHLDELREDLLAWAAGGTAEIVWSPHPYLIPFVESGHARISAEELDAWRAAWDALPTTATALDDRYPELVAGCDVVVTDGISMLNEAQVIGRPVVFLEREGHVPFNDDGEAVLRGVHRASSVTAAKALVERLVRDGDPLRETQQEIVRTLFGEPGAGRRVLAAVLEAARADGWRGGS